MVLQLRGGPTVPGHRHFMSLSTIHTDTDPVHIIQYHTHRETYKHIQQSITLSSVLYTQRNIQTHSAKYHTLVMLVFKLLFKLSWIMAKKVQLMPCGHNPVLARNLVWGTMKLWQSSTHRLCRLQPTVMSKWRGTRSVRSPQAAVTTEGTSFTVVQTSTHQLWSN